MPNLIVKILGCLFAILLVIIPVFFVSSSISRNLAAQPLLEKANSLFEREGLESLQQFCDKSQKKPTKSIGYTTWCSVYKNREGVLTLHVIVLEQVGPNIYRPLLSRDKILFLK